MRLLVRTILLALAGIHLFPATKHLGLFVEHPSVGEAWKGFGAALAVAIYCLPVAWYVRALGWLWRQRPGLLAVGGWALAVVHLVPASDHVPRFFAAPSFGDAWRGFGASLAVAWFAAPLPWQARAIARLRLTEKAVVGGMASILEIRFMKRTIGLTFAAGAALAVGAFFGARYLGASHARATATAAAVPPTPIELFVPHVMGNIVIDGETDDPAWRRAVARTNAFVAADGAPARPYSDARLAWGDGQLYVMLYAADENIESTFATADSPLWLEDAFHLYFASDGREHAFDVSPLGVLTDGERSGAGAFDYFWQSGARVAHDLDGTANAPGDDDEEWVIEMAIPLDALGMTGEKGERAGFSVRRCDTPRGHARTCASWGEGAAGGVIVLD